MRTQFAKIYEEAVLEVLDLSHGAMALFQYYSLKCNDKTGGYTCPNAIVLSEFPIHRSVFFRAKKELIYKKWIDVDGNYVRILKGRVPVAKQIPNSRKTATTQDNPTVAKQTPASRETATKRGVPVAKQIPNSRKTATLYKETDNTDNKETDIRTDILVQPEEPAAPVSKKSGTSPSGKNVDKILSDIETVFDHWKVVTDHPKAQLSDDRKRRIKARLADRPKESAVADLLQCLDGWKLSEFHQGDNGRHKVYDKIETIFKNNDTVEAHMARVDEKPRRPTVRTDDIDPSNPPARATFEELMSLELNVWHPGIDKATAFEKISTGYLRDNPGPESASEVEEYALSNGIR